MPDIVVNEVMLLEGTECYQHVTLSIDMTPVSAIALMLAAFYIVMTARKPFEMEDEPPDDV